MGKTLKAAGFLYLAKGKIMKLLTILLATLMSLSVSAADFENFQLILDKHLVDMSGPVQGYATAFNYEEAANDDETLELIQEQKQILSEFDISELEEKNQAIAFWINVYNFSMIDAVLSRAVANGELIVDSVRKISRVFKSRFINIGGTRMSLDGVEKGVLLGKDYKKKGWKDAKIHFAVNCASVGCPPLRTKVYKAVEVVGEGDEKVSKSLDVILEEATRASLATNRHLRVQDGKLKGTQLFQWYSGDFKDYVNKEGVASKTVNNFILNYVSDSEIIRFAEKSKAPSKINYNWKLNTVDNFVNDKVENLNNSN